MDATSASEASNPRALDTSLSDDTTRESGLHIGPELTLPEDPANVARVVAELEAAHSDAALVAEHEAAIGQPSPKTTTRSAPSPGALCCQLFLSP